VTGSKRRQTGQPFEGQKLQQAELARLKRENASPGRRGGFPKKGGSVLRETAQVKHAMTKANESRYAVGMMCRLMAVSRSGYYDWRHRPASDRSQANQLLKAGIKRVFGDEKGWAGAPRIARRPPTASTHAGRRKLVGTGFQRRQA
jgi:putative transposase